VKQSGGAWLPEIAPLRTVAAYVEEIPRDEPPHVGAARARLEGSGDPLREVLASWQGVGTASLAVGPEGGWSPSEAALFDGAGFRRASLGARVLRFETAAIAGLAVAAQHVLSLPGFAEFRSTNTPGE
jgi:16S rRNA (uracil1498-N3)-methyltransferase